MPKMKSNDGTNLFFNVTGQGTPLVLISGGFCDHHVWDDVIAFFQPEYQVITFDHRGIGQSDASPNDYTVELLASDVSCLLDHLNISSAHIIGHSMGGFVAQYFSAHHPKQILTLSLLSSLLVMNASGNDYLNALIDGIKNEPDKTRQLMPETAGRSQAEDSIIKQAILCRKHDARSYIDWIEAPSLIVSGLKEPVVTEEESKRLASSIKNVKKTVLLDCNHMLQRELPNELAKELLGFLHQCDLNYEPISKMKMI